MAEFKKLINPPIKASEIDSESATSGQVLTANGTGGASWQNASGGGGNQLYIHNIEIINANSTQGCSFSLYSSNANSFSIQSLYSYLIQMGIRIWVSGNVVIMSEAEVMYNLLNVAAFDLVGKTNMIQISYENGGNQEEISFDFNSEMSDTVKAI